MDSRIIKQVDAFTTIPFQGNPAGVVPIADGLTEEQMQLIAREKNLPETAFVLSSVLDGADVRIRWFTPTSEVDLCGHATIGSFHALAEDGLLGMKNDGEYRFRVETRSGLLNVLVRKEAKEIFVEFQLPIPSFEQLKTVPEAVSRSLGLEPAELLPDMPVVKDSYLYVPLRTRGYLYALTPDFTSLASACDSGKIVGVSLFTLDTVEPGSSFHSRFFAPSVGINEDPVTGSANGPLGSYMHVFLGEQGRSIASAKLPDGRTEYTGEQGDVLGRPGRVRVRVAGDAPTVASVSIVGNAVTVMQSTIFLKGTS